MQRWGLQENPRRCLCCRSHVTPEFRRGYGNENDRVHRYPDCDTITRLSEGSAAGKDVDLVDPLEDPGRFGKSFEELDSSVQALCHAVAIDGGEES